MEKWEILIRGQTKIMSIQMHYFLSYAIENDAGVKC